MKRLLATGVVLLCLLSMTAPVAAKLPATVKARVDYGIPGVSFLDVDVQIGDGDIPARENYLGWCPDKGHDIYVPMTKWFGVFSSLTPPDLGIPVQWNYINWILNHKGDYSVETIQEAIWHFDGGSPAPDNPLVEAAYADPGAATFVPTCDQLYAVILYLNSNTQVMIIEIETPKCVPAPEFPTVAVPAGTLLALGYAVIAVKSRKNHE